MPRYVFTCLLTGLIILFFTLSCVTPAGSDFWDNPAEATVTPAPLTAYEAETGSTTGSVAGPGRDIGTPEGEASGRQCVLLDTQGDYVEWTVSQAGNGLVVRYCVPDSATGGGLDYTISIYINGVHHTDLDVTSKYAWLYGGEDTPVDDPAAGPPSGSQRKIYDESHILLGQTLDTGDTIRLQKDSGDTAAYYYIDFIELELVPDPLPQPENSISVLDSGADNADGADSRSAFLTTISQAKSQGKTVWIPAGHYNLGNYVTANGVTIEGAGMWHTTLHWHNTWNNTEGGFYTFTGNTVFKNFLIMGECHIRGTGNRGFYGDFGTNTFVYSVWTEHVQVGAWVGKDYSNYPPTNLRFENCRWRNTGADGINFCNGTQYSKMINCQARSTGDDSFAIWSESRFTERPSKNNLISGCVAQLPWRAAGIAIYGGRGNTVTDCAVYDTLTYPGLTVSSGFWAYPFAGTTTFSNIELVRCGGEFWSGQQFGAIWVQSQDSNIASPINFSNIAITNATCSGIHFQSNNRVDYEWHDLGIASHIVAGNVTFNQITIDNPGTYGVYAVSYAKGGAGFSYTTITAPGLGDVNNQAGSNFVITKGPGVSW